MELLSRCDGGIFFDACMSPKVEDLSSLRSLDPVEKLACLGNGFLFPYILLKALKKASAETSACNCQCDYSVLSLLGRVSAPQSLGLYLRVSNFQLALDP